jgi:hypothetical protein
MSPITIVLFALVAVAAATSQPHVTGLAKGVIKIEDQGSCTMCTPFSEGGCGCADIAALRCKLNTMKQKITQLESYAHAAKEVAPEKVQALIHALHKA